MHQVDFEPSNKCLDPHNLTVRFTSSRTPSFGPVDGIRTGTNYCSTQSQPKNSSPIIAHLFIDSRDGVEGLVCLSLVVACGRLLRHHTSSQKYALTLNSTGIDCTLTRMSPVGTDYSVQLVVYCVFHTVGKTTPLHNTGTDQESRRCWDALF